MSRADGLELAAEPGPPDGGELEAVGCLARRG
ncbi:MAG: hypothetical protein AVDCRST_MAG59-1685 [uncultured Thermomicrobiales bacterium]|uniref:Uncharacterized protein n=1 Tax=uncultured Thermomicrobiales bacterium TaxID=1645740 RepID=A0A6J4UGY0_9BACT|nr:MAG: hypothetical protein AVDCRST_MAG59-1685 [uncultured Thermomicrobiales bacterium]